MNTEGETPLRFSASGGSIFERVYPGKLVERDPADVQRQAEIWMRDGLEAQERGLPAMARVYAHDALQAQLALSAWEQQRRAAGHKEPLSEAVAKTMGNPSTARTRPTLGHSTRA